MAPPADPGAEPVLTADDRACWETWMATAALHARTRAFARRVESARRLVEDVLDRTPDAAVSWSGGKDSSVLTHLVCVDRGARVRVYSEKDDLDYPGEEAYVAGLARAWDLDLEVLRPAVSLRAWVAARAAATAGGMHPGDDIHARGAALSKQHFYPLMEAADARHACAILGLRAEESAIRRHVRIAKGRYYRLATTGRWRALPIADWRALDVYAYAASRGIELLPVYRCVAFAHRDRPWELRKSWWLPGGAARFGQVAWLRRYWPSLYRQLLAWMPHASQLT